ncbi:heparin lyase I family protein [Gephyromycinifex aptenodytis]|uniref:heparin lyase I family protein n=1 Tax=Gephyromycinifex aptenodytis TaxID=2716227 RepID=UPI001445DB32|nr:heparin lyase I family protein [Gephyromycinifex aptenodytis]
MFSVLSRSRTTRLATSLALVAALGGGAAATLPSSASAAPAAATKAAAAATAPSSRFSAYKTHAWDGQQPIVGADQWDFVLPATKSAPDRRRSELWWALDGAAVSYSEGDVATYQAEVTAKLGQAANERGQWHVLWQLLGTTNGQWKGPSIALTVADGQLRITGGNGHEGHNPGAGRVYSWANDLAPYVDGRTYQVKIQDYLSSDPNSGWISVWVDGKKVLDRWRPTSRTGLRPGTFYPGSSEVYSRSGLYRGSDRTKTPTYQQSARHTKVLMS